MFDLHIHTNFSPDSKMSINEACNAAIKSGLKVIAITDHMDHECYEGTAVFDIPTYRKKIAKAQNRYEGKLKILVGVEEGYQKIVLDQITHDLEKLKPDYIIYSNHFAQGKDLFLKEYYVDKDRKKAVEVYLEAVIEGLREMPDFNCIGHLGYLRRYAPYDSTEMSYLEFKDYYDKIFKFLIQNGKGLEINTGSIFRNGFTIPEMDVVSAYLKAGGEILTLGSDAHKANGVGIGFDVVISKLKDLNAKWLCYFEQGKPIFEKIT